MNLEIHIPERSVLWRVVQFGCERSPVGRRYWYDNVQRLPPGLVVVQATLAGEIILRNRQGDHPVPAGHLAVFVYGDHSSYGVVPPGSTDYVCQWVGLEGAGLAEHVFAFCQAHAPVIDVRNNSSLRDDIGRLTDLAQPNNQAPPTDMAHAVHLFMMRLFEHAGHHRHAQLTPVERAIDQLVRQPHAPWSIKQVADQHQVSREHLCRMFRQRVGQTPHAFLGHARLERALYLLAQTRLPLADIANQAGYATTHMLSRQVRRATGRPPSQCRAPLVS